MDDFEVVIGRRRGPSWTRVGYGLYRQNLDGALVVPASEDRAGRRRAWHADLRAWQALLPDEACFTHLTAAAVHGLWLPPLPERAPVWVCLPKTTTRPKRRELRVLRPTAPVTPVPIAGLRVAPLAETLLACARDLGLLDLAVLLDHALSRDSHTATEIGTLVGSGRWGAPALLEALAVADPRSESPWETLLRLFHVLCGVPVEPQYEVRGPDGRFVARGDLRLVGTRTLHEYDGAGHRDRRTHVRDLARDRRLVGAGWTRRGYVSGDLLGRGHLILREADDSLGRRHDPARLQRWYAALRSSLFSAAGRRRLMTRWGC